MRISHIRAAAAIFSITLTLALSPVYASLPPFGPIQPHSQPHSKPDQQHSNDFGISKGKFLVASKKMNDRNFSSTVILLVDYGDNGAMGLIVNRPAQKKETGTDIPARDGHGPVFSGGPVATNTHWVLIRSKEPIKGCTPVLEEVCMAESSGVLDILVMSQSKPPEFRVYIGYSGWMPGQLERELSRGGWHLIDAQAQEVFSGKPEELWDGLLPRVTAPSI